MFFLFRMRFPALTQNRKILNILTRRLSWKSDRVGIHHKLLALLPLPFIQFYFYGSHEINSSIENPFRMNLEPDFFISMSDESDFGKIGYRKDGSFASRSPLGKVASYLGQSAKTLVGNKKRVFLWVQKRQVF
jgi:hypothetical protein